MPRSFSRSLESMTRSATDSLARKVPDLAQHGVDEGGLAVVDVGDDGDVTDGLRCGAHSEKRSCPKKFAGWMFRCAAGSSHAPALEKKATYQVYSSDAPEGVMGDE